MTAVDRVSDVAAGSPHFGTDPLGGPLNDRAGVVAPGHARQCRAHHLALDVPDVAGAYRAGRDLDDRGLGIRLGIRQLEQVQVRDRTEFSELQSAHGHAP
jgi:hypothetical protein